jgi:hypothetical protein
MALEKNIIVDRIEMINIIEFNYFILNYRKRIQIIEDGKEISAIIEKYTLNPDHDTSTIESAIVLNVFNAVMAEQVKSNYQSFLETQKTPE